MFWLRPGAEATAPRVGFVAERTGPALDTALFDVDGVLLDVRESFRRSVLAATEHLVRVVNGLDAGTAPLATDADVAAFKHAGGFNSDWDLTLALAALCTAQVREWRGTALATVRLAEWAARAAEAARAGAGGLAWLRATVPASAIPPADVARWAHDEFYWGAALCESLYGHTPRYAPEATGTVHNETLLLEPHLLPMLRAFGITRFGLITGRADAEIAYALGTLLPGCGPELAGTWHEGAFGRSPFSAIITADQHRKPDPRALVAALERTGATGALYVGDTADDLDTVLRYRAEAQQALPGQPPVLAVMVVPEAEERQLYQARGADVLLTHLHELPEALAHLAAAQAGG